MTWIHLGGVSDAEIFTDYVNAWLLWGKNHERHARMVEALLKDSAEHEKVRPVQRALARPPPPRNASETVAGESNAELKRFHGDG